MAKKFYVVWEGREKGIFTDWDTCKKQVEKFPGARFKSFESEQEAQAAFRGTGKSTSAARTVQAVDLVQSEPSAVAGKRPSSAKKVKTYTTNDISAMAFDTKIFTDGGCEPNPGKAGSGLAVYRDEKIDALWYGLYNPNGTNNTAELNALHQGLLIAQEELAKARSVAIFCDSQYAIQCVTEWAFGWQKKGWKKAGGEIKNLELIKQIFALYQTLQDKIEVLHVNGHVGVEGNELADRMSILAVSQRTVSFTRYVGALDVAGILKMKAG